MSDMIGLGDVSVSWLADWGTLDRMYPKVIGKANAGPLLGQPPGYWMVRFITYEPALVAPPVWKVMVRVTLTLTHNFPRPPEVPEAALPPQMDLDALFREGAPT